MITKLNNKAVANVTSIPVALGDMVLVSSATASSSASIEFSLGNYKEYKFFFVNIHPSVDSAIFEMNFSTDNGSNYNVTKTSTSFGARNREDGNNAYADLSYDSGRDLAQSTSNQALISRNEMGFSNDDNLCGSLNLFNASSNIFVKHFIANTSFVVASYAPANINNFTAGYANTTSALTNIKFQMSSGNIDAGKILMFGIN